jgi:hypothetical protein
MSACFIGPRLDSHATNVLSRTPGGQGLKGKLGHQRELAKPVCTFSRIKCLFVHLPTYLRHSLRFLGLSGVLTDKFANRLFPLLFRKKFVASKACLTPAAKGTPNASEDSHKITQTSKQFCNFDQSRTQECFQVCLHARIECRWVPLRVLYLVRGVLFWDDASTLCLFSGGAVEVVAVVAVAATAVEKVASVSLALD